MTIKMKLMTGLTGVVALISSPSFAQASCQHPYCDGPVSAPTSPDSNPTIYNPQYCYQGRCYPGAYIPGAVDMNGNTRAAAMESSFTPADRVKQELAQVGPVRFTAPDYKVGSVRHIVLFRYKANVTQAEKEEVNRRFLSLKALAKRNGQPYIRSIVSGSQISGEGVDQNLEQGFIVTFNSQGDRNYYVGQPILTDVRFFDAAHQEFKEFVGPLIESVIVFDFVP